MTTPAKTTTLSVLPLLLTFSVSSCGSGVAGLFHDSFTTEPPNEAPSMDAVGPPTPLLDQYTGNVDIPFVVADPNADLVSIKVEFNDNVVGGSPVGPWKLARRAGTPSSQVETPEFGVVNLRASSGGIAGTFVWDSAFDLSGLERDVIVRMTPRDEEFANGLSVQSAFFRVDSNAAPQSSLNEVNFVQNTDARGGIPIEFQVFDEESDTVRVLFQWARQGEAFPPLPTSANQLISLLDDDDQAIERARKQICTEIPATFQGRLGALQGPLPSHQVRLPELAGSAAGLLSYGLAGRSLEFLRASKIPQTVTWGTSPFSSPVGAIPSPLATAAFVLDQSGPGWRVHAVDLATGMVLRQIAVGPGTPRAISLLRSGSGSSESGSSQGTHFFVATDASIFRHTYPEGDADGVLDHAIPGGPSAIAALGRDVALTTSASGLIRHDMGAGSHTSLLGAAALQDPQGIIVDPVDSNRVYISERGADRVVAFGLDTMTLTPLNARVAGEDVGTLGAIAFPRPGGLATENAGARLLVVCEENTGGASLRGIEVRRASVGKQGADEGPRVFELIEGGLGADATVMTGKDSLRVVTQPTGETLRVGGGVAEVCRIAGGSPYNPRTQVVTLAAAPLLSPNPGTPWRVRPSVGAATAAAPNGNKSVFIWDSADAQGGGSVRVRLVALDTDAGIPSDGNNSRPVRVPIDVDPRTLPSNQDSLDGLVTADLNGDGKNDLITVSSFLNEIQILSQGAPGTFLEPTVVLTHPSIDRPSSVTTADLNQDGRLDLIVASRQIDTVVLLTQDPNGNFSVTGTITDTLLSSVEEVAVGDLNGDGLGDIFVANSNGLTRAAVFYQQSSGQFGPGQPLAANSPVRSICLRDLNGDGRTDLTCYYDFNSVAAYYQDNQGNLASTPTIFEDPQLSTRAFELADIDGNGTLDLIMAGTVSGSTDGALSIFLQDSAGAFADPTSLPLPSSLENPTEIEAGDFNGDGTVDLAAIATRNGIFGGPAVAAVLFASSPGQFGSPAAEVFISEFNFSSRTTVSTDFDGDGRVDLASVTSSNVADPVLLLQHHAGRLDSEPLVLNDPSPDFPSSVVVCDLDGDGDSDFASARDVTQSIEIRFQSAPGQYSGVPLALTAEGQGAPNGLAPADVDGDGQVDLIATFLDSSQVGIFHQTSPGQFAPAVFLPANGLSRPGASSTADLDGDGDQDITVADGDAGRLVLYSQIAPRQFEQRLALVDPSLNGVSAVVATDLDGDGDVDLAATSTGSERVLVYLQNPAGAFSDPPLALPGGGRLQDIEIGDVDDDGDLDIVAASAAGRVVIFPQEQPGSWSRAPIIVSHEDLFSVIDIELGDFDGDGDLDLAAASFGAVQSTRGVVYASSLVFTQESPGLFSTHPQRIFASDVTDTRCIALGDLDGDSTLDLIRGNSPGIALTDRNVGGLTTQMSIFFGGR